MKPSLVVCAFFSLCCIAEPQTAHIPEQSSPGQNLRQQSPADQVPRQREPDPVAFEGVQSSLSSGRKEEAFRKAQAIVSVYPDNVHANVLAGAVLLEMAKPAEAVSYFRKVVAANPADAHFHSLLLEAYAESGDRPHRDQERATLRRFHTDGKHPEFSLAHGFMIERIPVGNESVAAIEYFAPEGPNHFSYRFDVYDTADKMMEFIALASEDKDQVFLPKSVPAGARRYSLNRYTQNEQALLGFIDGMPSYDDLRARVVKILHAETDVDVAAPPKK
ncbi:MAG TPA: hypothetical protein VHX60_01815 [Acidobacteriaceae bacterium]|jgi:hypothetical protein|nr:hypothetical protein [Acidobacteriaceae bacterium]